jgi:(p)ppGpp synthase/HD superfamily hydrolase
MVESTQGTPLLTDRFQRAFTLASEVHATQVRKGSGVPYLAHLMSVAALVLEHGGTEDAAVAGLLHDAVEDCADGTAMQARIRREFDGHVAGVVMGCSDAVAVPGRAKPPWRERKQAYIDRLAAEQDPDVLLVSACDKLHNTRTILADLRIIGPALWDYFNEKDPAVQLWYYQSLADCYTGRVPAELARELNRVIGQIRSLALPPGSGSAGQPSPP